MDVIPFDPDGGPVFAEILSGFANPGSYTLILWEANSNSKAMDDVSGNFINADDDRHALPAPVSDNHGRIVEAFVTLAPIGSPKQFFAALVVTQDGRRLGEIAVGDTTTAHTVTVDLFARLEANA